MRNLTNLTLTEITADSGVQMLSLTTGEQNGKLPAEFFLPKWTDVAEAPAATGNEPGPRWEKLADGSLYLIDREGRAEKIEFKQALDVNLTPIAYVPTATGNTENLGEMVIDPDGNVWAIDLEGDAIRVEWGDELNVLTTVQPTPNPTGNTTNLMTVFKDNTGTTWIVDRNGDAIACGTPENVYYQTDSLTFPVIAAAGDELFVTEDGTDQTKVLEQWIFNGTTWQQRPQTEPVYAAGAILAAIACVGTPMVAPSGDLTDIRTIGAGGDFASLPAALADATVADGTILQLTGDQVLDATLEVNKAVVIDGNGFQIDSLATGPTNMINITVGAVLKNAKIDHNKTTNTSVEAVVTLNSPSATAWLVDNEINCQEFGVVTRGQFVVARNKFAYIGASLTNSHRFIGIYGVAGESRVEANTFTASAQQGATRYSNFILMTSAAGSTFSGSLYITNNKQTGGNLRQFFLHEAGAPTGLELYVANNTFDDLNGGIGILSTNVYAGYSKIGIYKIGRAHV